MNNSSQHIAVGTASFMTTSDVTAWCTAFAVESVIVAIGNLFIITVFAKTIELRRQHRHYFLMNLAVADFFVGGLAAPLFVYILGGLYNLWPFSKYKHTLYSISIFLDMFSGISSIAFLSAIAVERLYSTLYPTKYRKTKRFAYTVIAFLLWAISAVLPGIRIHLGEEFNSLYTWMPIVCMLLVTIGSSYIVIWVKVLFFSSKRLNQSRERRLNVTVTILTLTSLSTWLPFIVLNIVNEFHPVSIEREAVFSTKILHYGNSLVNPFLFALKMPQFRKAAQKIFCSFPRQKPAYLPSEKRRLDHDSFSSHSERTSPEVQTTPVWK